MRVFIAIGTVVLFIIAALVALGIMAAFTEERSNSVSSLIDEERYQEALPLAKKNVRANRLLAKTRIPGDVQLNLAEALNLLGYIEKSSGLFGDAEIHYREAIEIAEALGDAFALDFARYTNNLAILFHDIGRNDEAFPLAEKVASIRLERLGPNDPIYAVALNNLGSIRRSLGQFEEALAHLQSARAILEEQGETSGQSYRFLLNNLADVYLSTDQLDQAIAVQRDIVAVNVRAHGKGSQEYALGINNLAYVLQEAGEAEESKRLYNEARECFQTLNKTQSQTYAVILANLAFLASDEENYADCENYLREALTIQESTVGVFHPSYLEDLENLAATCDLQEKLEEAEALYRKAADLTAENEGTGSDAHLSRLESIAWFFDGNGRTEEAETAMREAMAVALEAQGEQSFKYTDLMDSLCLIIRYSETPLRAEPCYQDLGALVEENLGALSPEHIDFMYGQVEFYEEIEQLARAEAALDTLIGALAAGGPEHNAKYLEARSEAGYFHQNHGHADKAEEHYTAALDGWREADGPDSENYSYALYDLGSLYWEQKTYDRAEALLQEMLALDRKLYADDPDAVMRSAFHVAMFYGEQQRDTEAEALYREVLAHYDSMETPDYYFYAYADCAEGLAKILTRREDFAEGLSLLNQTLTRQQSEFAEYSHFEARILASRAALFHAWGKSEEAERDFLKAKATLEADEAQSFPSYSDLCTRIAAFYTETGDAEKAERILSDVPGSETPTEVKTQASPSEAGL